MEDKFYVSETDVGRGIFANEKIKKGEHILEFIGPIVTDQQAMDLDMERFGRRIGNALQIGHDKYIYIEEPGRLVNHSCDPNSGIKNDTTLVAIRDITKDEEIRFDYSTTMDEDYPGIDNWTMECSCGAANCRKIVKDFKHIPKKTRDRYLKLGVVQKFIAEQYIKKRKP
jgi:SET domain-containing protein